MEAVDTDNFALQENGDGQKLRHLTQRVLNSYEFARALSRRIKKWRFLMENSISELGLSLGEFGVLVTLSESGPQLMVDLAKNQGITQAAITGIIDKLEEMELAEREPSKTDKRKVRALITAKGEEQVSSGIRLYKKLVEKATRRMSLRDMNFVLERLDEMLDAANT